MKKFRKVTRLAINLLVSIFLVFAPLLGVARPAHADVSSTLEQIRSFIPSSTDFQIVYNNANSAANAASCATEIVSFVQSRYSSFPTSMLVDCTGSANNFNNIMLGLGQDFSRTSNFSALPAPVLGPNFTAPVAGSSAQLSNPTDPIYASVVLSKASPIIEAAGGAKNVSDCTRDVAVAIEFVSIETRLALLPEVGIPGGIVTAGWIIKSVFDCGGSYKLISSALTEAMSTDINRLPTGAPYCAAPKYASIACLNTQPNGSTSGGTPTTSTSGSTSGSQPVPVCAPAANQVAVYTEKNYQGTCAIKGFGDYNNAAAIGLPDNSVKSVRVGSGAKVWLCDNENINSFCEWFPPDDTDLSNNSLNVNTVSSMRVISDQPTSSGCNPGATEVAFFVDTNYGGACLTRGVGVYSDPGAIGLPNDSISSIKVGANAKVRVCENSGMNSPCVDFDQNDDRLGYYDSIGDNTISAAEVTVKGVIRLCDNTNYGGECKYFGTGQYNLQDYGFNNRTESVAYDSGWGGMYHIVLYTDDGQSGYLYHADNSVGDLHDPYNNNISSIKIYKNGPPGANNIAPADSTILPTNTTSVTLNFDGGDQRRVHIWGDGFDQSLDWTTATTWQLNNLAQGQYSWQVQARAVTGEGAWTSASKFTIDKAPTVISEQLTMDSGSIQSVQVQAFDSPGEQVALSANSLPSFANFTDTGNGVGVLTFTPSASQSGVYAINVAASDGDLSNTGQVWVKVNSTAPAGYQAEYFNNLTLTGTPVLTRSETDINNDWGSGGPGSGINVDNFSARWTKTTNFAAGDYTFTVTADDGVRLYIDGTLAIDKWIDQGATTYTTTKTLAAGNHTLKMEYYDSGWDAVAKFSYQQVVSPPAGQQTVNSQIMASSDDAEENASTSMSLTSSDLELTCDTGTSPCPSNDSGKQSIGMRFGSLGIPKNATINSAYIVFTAKEAQSEATNVTFNGQAADNAPTFTTTSGNISSRTKTTASASWSSLPAWTVGNTYRSPDLSPIVQEIVNRSGWASGNAAAMIVTGLGHRTAWSYDGNSASVAKLVVTYTPAASTQLIANGQYKLVNTGSSKALDVNGGGTTDGTNVQIWTDNSGSAQKWQVTLNTDGTYKLVNPNSSKVLDVNGAGTSDGANVQIWTDNSGVAQKWQITQNTDGTYKLKNPNSGKVLDVSGGSSADGANVQIWTDNGSAAQKWQIVATSTAPPPPSVTPSFTGSGTVSASSFAVGNTVTMNGSFTSTASANTTSRIHFEVRSPSDMQVFAKDFDNEAFAPGQTKSYTATWTIPQGAATGTYTVKGGAVSADWGTWYLWLNNMGQFTVNTPSAGTELLSAPWNLVGNNGANEKYQSIASNALAGKTTVRVTYNLHGLNALGGDASALIFDQNGWRYVSLSNYGQNGLNGSQTVDIPISAFGLDLSQPVGTLHTRFWYGGAFTVDITSVKVL